MATYLYKCPKCGDKTQSNRRDCNGNPWVCQHDGAMLLRDYKAEAVGFKTVPGGYKEASRRG